MLISPADISNQKWVKTSNKTWILDYKTRYRIEWTLVPNALHMEHCHEVTIYIKDLNHTKKFRDYTPIGVLTTLAFHISDHETKLAKKIDRVNLDEKAVDRLLLNITE